MSRHLSQLHGVSRSEKTKIRPELLVWPRHRGGLQVRSSPGADTATLTWALAAGILELRRCCAVVFLFLLPLYVPARHRDA